MDQKQTSIDSAINRVLRRDVSRRDALKVLSLGAVAAGLAACGVSTSSAAPPASGSAPSASGSAPSAASSGPLIKPAPKITVWSNNQDQLLKSAQNWATELKASKGIEVEVVAVDYGEGFAKATAAWLAGTADFDAIVMANQWTGEWAQAGFLENLDPWIASDSGDNQVKQADFIPRSWEAQGSWVTDDGQVHQVEIPFNSEGRLRFYRTDIFEKAKLEPPKDWLEYQQQLKFFNNGKNPDFPGVYGAAEMFGNPQGWGEFGALYWSLFPFDTVKTTNGFWDDRFQVVMDDAAYIKAAQLMSETLPNQPGGVKSWNLPEATAFFEAGTAAQFEIWPSGYGAVLNDNTKLKGKVGAYPVLPAEPGRPSKPFGGGWGLAINSKVSDDRKTAAWEFIKLATSEAAERVDFESRGRGPSRLAVYADSGLQSKYFWMKAMGEAAAQCVIPGRIKGMNDFYGGDFWTTGVTAFQGGLDPAAAAAQARTQLKALLTKNGYPQDS